MNEQAISVEELADREAIRDVIHQYSRGADRRDVELMKDCYHPDGTDQHTFFSGNGWEFCEAAMTHLNSCKFSMHQNSNILIKFSGDRAFVENYVKVVHRLKVDDGYLDHEHFGRYCDVFEKRNGVWKILHRLHLPDGDRMIKVVGLPERPVDAAPDDVVFELGCAGPDDPSYQEFAILDDKRSYPPIDDLFRR